MHPIFENGGYARGIDLLSLAEFRAAVAKRSRKEYPAEGDWSPFVLPAPDNRVGKADQQSMDKSLDLCRRHSSPGVDAVRDKFLELVKAANGHGNSSVVQIMRQLVELEVREIKYNKALRSAPIEKVRRALDAIHLVDLTLRTLEKGRLVRLKKKAALDKELVKQIKLSVFA